MKVQPIRTRVFQPRENLEEFIKRYVRRLAESDILVVTSKIVALSEGRFVPLTSEKEKEAIIKRESVFMLKTQRTRLTIKDNMVMANAGVDESNADGRLILLPHDSFRAARHLRTVLRDHFRLKRLGVIITDSRTAPLRAGITGAALGYAGFRGLKNYNHTPDIFGRLFHHSRVNVADSLATAAVLTMGEGREQQPLAVISGAPVVYAERVKANELRIDIREDMYGPLFRRLR